jgi:hypothetical protein
MRNVWVVYVGHVLVLVLVLVLDVSVPRYCRHPRFYRQKIGALIM